MSSGLYIHVWVNGNGIDFDVFTDEVTEWDRGWCHLLPDPLLLGCGKFGVLVGGRGEGDDVIVGFACLHEGKPGSLIGFLHVTFRFLRGSPGHMEQRAGVAGDGG